MAVAVVVVVVAVAAAAVGPAVPSGVADGDLVEVDGVVYQRHGDRLYTLDDPALDAEPVAAGAPAITVTGSRLDRARDKALRAETIDGDALRETGARTLADVLEEQGGLQVNSARGLGAEVFVDGLDGRHVLILIDGRPVTGKVDNRVDVSRLPISAGSIERVEIVRGPMSALYGSDAIGGVVNIITKRPDGDHRLELELGGQLIPGVVGDRAIAGALPWATFGVHGTGGAGPLALRVDITAADLAGYDRGGRASGPDVPDGKGDLPDRRNAGVNVDATALLGEDWSVRTTLLGSFSQGSAFVAAAAPFRDANDNADVAASAAFTGPLEAGLPRPIDVTADLRVDRFVHRFAALPTGGAADPPAFCDTPFAPACPAPPRVKTLATRHEARLELRGQTVFVDDPAASTAAGRELSLSAGAVVLQERAQREDGDGNDTLPGGGLRSTTSVYGELLWRPLSWLTLLPGARVDAFLIDGAAGALVEGAFDDAVAVGPKLAARLDGPWGLALRASLGQGFRLPSFEERFLRFDHSELGYVVDGNPALRPERSVGARLEGTWSTTSGAAAPPVPLELGVEASTNVLQDLITESAAGVTAAGVPRFSYVNASRAWTAALTTRASVKLVELVAGWLRVGLDGTWQYLWNAVDASGCPPDDPWLCSAEDGARSLPLRPAHSVDLTGRLVVVPSQTTLFVRTDLMSERPVVDDVAPASAIVSVGLRQPVAIPGGDGAELVVGLENLLDQTDAVYGPKPGRHVSFNLRVW